MVRSGPCDSSIRGTRSRQPGGGGPCCSFVAVLDSGGPLLVGSAAGGGTYRMKALVAMIRKEFVHISRDRQLVAFVFGLPIVLVVLFGYALRLKVEHMVLAVCDLDRTFFSVSVKDQLRNDRQFE